MELTIKIQGMMCPHCEARVKKVLEDAEGVLEVAVSHERGTAVVKGVSTLSAETLTKRITDNGYTVTEVTKA